LEIGDATGVEVFLQARGGEPFFADLALRETMFERTLFDDGMKGCCVLPEGMRLVYDRTVELWPVLRSLKVQTEEYAEMYGAPQGRVWRRGFGLRRLDEPRDLVERAAVLLSLAVERGLVEKIEHYPFAISGFHDRQGRIL
jgi:hypothetical protein